MVSLEKFAAIWTPLKLFHDFRIFAAITAKARPFFVSGWGTGGRNNKTEVGMANPSQNSLEYYRERERYEISLAEKAASQAIRDIHLEMARCYRKMLEQLETMRAAS